MLEKNIGHGVIPNINPTLRIDSDGRIDYSNGNSLIWSRDNTSSRNGFYFNYNLNGRRIRLNDMVDYGEWIFVPVKSGFFVKLREDEKDKPYPEIQLSVPKLKASELEILAALHEIGHANLYNETHNYMMRRKLLTSTGTFTEQLIKVDEFLSGRFDHPDTYEMFSEVTAWRYSIKEFRRLGILKHFDDKEKMLFILKHCKYLLEVLDWPYGKPN